MTAKPDLIVFTDLDGTLIDHDTYEWEPAREALEALAEIGAGVILASSKTAVEIAELRKDLGLDHWCAIVENGAGLLPALAPAQLDEIRYQDLRARLSNLDSGLRDLFLGFGDVDVNGVVEMTGLDHASAALAKQRAFSEPGLWSGSDAQRKDFVEALRAMGIQAQQGGRFLTLSFGGNKVDQMRTLIAQHDPKHTIALGDAPNDVQMLEHAEFGVVVANPHRAPLPPLVGEEKGTIIRTKTGGPSGWNKAILDLLDRLDLR